jgi:hypothetical protein
MGLRHISFVPRPPASETTRVEPMNDKVVLQAEAALATLLAVEGINLGGDARRKIESALEVIRTLAQRWP